MCAMHVLLLESCLACHMFAFTINCELDTSKRLLPGGDEVCVCVQLLELNCGRCSGGKNSLEELAAAAAASVRYSNELT